MAPTAAGTSSTKELIIGAYQSPGRPANTSRYPMPTNAPTTIGHALVANRDSRLRPRGASPIGRLGDDMASPSRFGDLNDCPIHHSDDLRPRRQVCGRADAPNQSDALKGPKHPPPG